MKTNSRTGGIDHAALRNLSARELVELIEHEQAMLQRYEAGRRLGAEALLEAAKNQLADDPSDALSGDSETRRETEKRLTRQGGRQRRRYRKVA